MAFDNFTSLQAEVNLRRSLRQRPDATSAASDQRSGKMAKEKTAK
jgi:hypothetical protein